MNDFEEVDSNSLFPTFLDVERIKCMEEGDKLDGELGNWSVLRYKNNYTLLLNNHPRLEPVIDFDDKESLIRFLQKG